MYVILILGEKLITNMRSQERTLKIRNDTKKPKNQSKANNLFTLSADIWKENETYMTSFLLNSPNASADDVETIEREKVFLKPIST